MLDLKFIIVEFTTRDIFRDTIEDITRDTIEDIIIIETSLSYQHINYYHFRYCLLGLCLPFHINLALLYYFPISSYILLLILIQYL